MKINLNGEKTSIENIMSIEELLEDYGFEQSSIAVAMNGSFVPKSSYNSTLLSDGDSLDIVSPMQGG